MLNSELEVLKFWHEQKIFEKSLKQREGCQNYVFFDGPPFATGLPHWGHILISQVKDTVLRFWTQKGYYVPRRWGWDCHGAPIEVLAEKELGITDKRQIYQEIGIAKFNQYCRDKIMLYDGEWRKMIDRVGRWVDMDDQYRTMDNDYIESVWWGLGQLWQKGLLYKDYRISLYSPSVGVPLTHTDVAMEVKYEDETTPSSIVRFRVNEISAKKLSKKILEEIAFNYSEQLRYRNDLEKRIISLGSLGRAKRAEEKEIMKSGHPEFDPISWDTFKTDEEAVKEIAHLEHQLEVVLENIDTLNKMKEVLGKSFPLSLLSWTTTPWTFPANVALAVGSEIEYSLYYLGATGELVILAEKRAIPVLSLQLHESVLNSSLLQKELENITDSSEYFGKLGVDIIKIVSFSGQDLEGLEYIPTFEPTQKVESYEQRANIFKVHIAGFATAEEGTGIVQISPAYGPEDFELKQQRNLPVLTCLNEYGEIRDDLNIEIKQAFGKNFLEANTIINDILDKKGLLFAIIPYTHRVPVYERDGKKVYYAAQEGWFIAETKLKARSLELNDEINWHPEFLKYGRFGKGLESAPDWCISRSRFWGSPLPIWQTADGSKTIFIDSVEKLEKYVVNPIYRILNTRDLKPEFYESGKTVIITDAHSKLPLGISATQYRSKSITEMRKEKELDITRFANYAQRLLDEILELFNKYEDVQVMFSEDEERFWTTWILALHPDSKKVNSIFYFYRSVEEDLGQFKPKGSIKQLDFHRPFIDEIILRDEVGNIYTRVPDVLDTWVDSGSMPWASWHYPAENKDFVENHTPADWIVEAQDQTRGWFRTLHVLSSGVFNRPAFKNINTTGLVLAADGRKMSKSKKNYTDPNIVLDKFGADSLRAYLLASPLVNADSFNFVDKDLENTFRETTLLLSNTASYLKHVFAQHAPVTLVKGYKHPLNRWWQAYTQDYVQKIDQYMSQYNIGEAARLIVPYIQNLSTWYIRRSKDLLNENGVEVSACLQESLRLFAMATASLQPFNMERLWSLVKTKFDPDSVHLTDFPVVEELSEKQKTLLEKMNLLRELISEIHTVRKQSQIRVRQPLYGDFAKLDIEKGVLEILMQECNLLSKDLSKMEGEIFEKKSDFGLLRIDLVIDKDLAVLGFCRDFERSVQDFRKKQGFRAGQTVSMKWQLTQVQDDEILSKVIEQLDWKKLCVEVKWTENLDSKVDKSFMVKDLVTVLVD